MYREISNKGFTLIELLIVISIIAILALTIVPNFIGFDVDAKVVTSKTNLDTLRTRVQLFRAKEGRYPASLGELLSGVYFDAGIEKPYLEKLPKELISSKAGNDSFEDQRANSALSGDGGWTYITDKAKVVIDHPDPLPDSWGEYAGQIPSSW